MSVVDLEMSVNECCALCKERSTSPVSLTRAVAFTTCIVTFVATAMVGAVILWAVRDIGQCTEHINNIQNDLRTAQYKISTLEVGLKNIQIRATFTELTHKLVTEDGSDHSELLHNDLPIVNTDDDDSWNLKLTDEEDEEGAYLTAQSSPVNSLENIESQTHLRHKASADSDEYDLPKELLSSLQLRHKRSNDVRLSSAENANTRRLRNADTRRRPRDADTSSTQQKNQPKVKRDKGGKGKGKGKNKNKMRLPAIQLVGGGPVDPRHDKSDLRGLWHLDWVTKDGVFEDYLQANNHGGIHIAKSGVYLMYAQITLTHQNKKGYHVLKGARGQKEIITTCTHITNYLRSEAPDEPASCATVKIVQLVENDRIFIEEIPSNTAANYSKTTSFFGLIKIDDN